MLAGTILIWYVPCFHVFLREKGLFKYVLGATIFEFQEQRMTLILRVLSLGIKKYPALWKVNKSILIKIYSKKYIPLLVEYHFFIAFNHKKRMMMIIMNFAALPYLVWRSVLQM